MMTHDIHSPNILCGILGSMPGTCENIFCKASRKFAYFYQGPYEKINENILLVVDHYMEC